MHTITYKEQELPMVFDYSVVRDMKINHQKDITDSDQFMGDYEALELATFKALERGHKLEGKPFTLTQADVIDIISSENYADVNLIYIDNMQAHSFSKKNKMNMIQVLQEKAKAKLQNS